MAAFRHSVVRRKILAESLYVFVAGLGGVFVGMGFLYASIRVTAFIVGRIGDIEDNA